MLDQHDLRRELAQVDAFVLPSYWEGLPRSLIEGLAAGRPAIATNIRGCRELVQDGVNGFLVPARDAGALAAAIRRLAALPPPEFEAMATRARGVAWDRYREVDVARRLIDAYAELGVRP